MNKSDVFNVSHKYTEQTLFEALEPRFSIIKGQSITERLTFFDTFDWRLFKAALVLYQTGNKLVLQKHHSDDILLQQPVDNIPKFVWDLPEGMLRERLEPIIKMRALLKLTEANLSTTSFRILNKNDKTIARLIHETLQAHPKENAQPMAEQLRINPVRGYSKAARKIHRQLKTMGIDPIPDNLLVKALELGDRNPQDYLAGLKVKLEPEMRADEATKAILRSSLRVIKLNEEGVKKDIDTEFLHDFRVAVRRTRSVLSQVKGVFPEETTLRFKQDFAVIGKLSNELRDLDVYLLAEDNFKGMLPNPVHSDIDPLFEYMKQKRATALQRVIKGLNSEHYAETIHAWETFLNEPPLDSPTAAHAATPIKALAQNRIYKRYRRIVKWGNQILENTEDEQLHALRIECKKLRYLMDFFESLFPAKKINALIKQVKKLQTNLGDFNDLCVQEEYLLNTTAEMPGSDLATRKVFVAIGCLVSSLQQERVRVKANFAHTFTQFATPANQELFKQLFAVRK